ncbi:hypothetical protein F7734_32270 [Scytonema sp. UIC 10036]|uniref:hypothetical protein n=1 Tax=Scytonema sp. UIC 10036 TaxID=2304196 RepID=UPI0012DA0A40|nr:hypothetical protein [Scytonema sp. UIC 10036]MUG96766.1 hypothetical protein [Scytonema sp. UIC 10036]
MSSTRSSINLNVCILTLISFIRNWFKQQKNKTHDYSQLVCGHDYVFEPMDNLTQGYMTGQGKGVKPGDCILLQIDSQIEKYQVEEIDYYSEPSDMWMALLKKMV